MTYREWLIGFRDHYAAIVERAEDETVFLCPTILYYRHTSTHGAKLKAQIDADMPACDTVTLTRYLGSKGWSRLDYLNHLIEQENAK